MDKIKELVDKCVDAIEEKKGEKILILDISGLSPIADYFVLANGNNTNQLQAMAEEIYNVMAKEGVHPKQTEGYNSANWILIDFGDFIIHLFSNEAREFYNLERLWKDAKQEVR